ncbi:T9SS type A sorting domain-containing protein [candidate division GN15 bacterium]|nr:T9SS type A sorting domain-containing protein [candidate division GN15 bacterium]
MCHILHEYGNWSDIKIRNMEASEVMKKSLVTSFVLGLAVLLAMPAMAQDAGAPDTLELRVTRPDIAGNDSSFVVETWLWTDSQTIVGTTLSWVWENDNITYDSGRFTPGHGNPPFGLLTNTLIDNSLAQTNLLQMFAMQTAGIGVGVAPTGDWQHWCSHYFTVNSWSASDSIVIDTMTIPGFTGDGYVLIALAGSAEIDPVWKGPVVIKDPSDASDDTPLEVPQTFSLAQNYPNPFNPETNINFSLPTASEVRLEVFNLLGQKVTTLANQEYDAGQHTVVWDGTSDAGNKVASGVYFYRLVTDQFSDTKKMLMLK